MAQDPIGYLPSQYKELGPIFRLKLLSRRFTVLAGIEANQLFSHKSHELLSSKGLWQDFARTVHATELLVSSDGEPHRRLRKVMKPGFSSDAVAHRLPELVSLTREIVDQHLGVRIRVVDLMQRLTTQQLGVLLCDVRTDELFDALRLFIKTLLNVTVIHRWPRVMLYHPSFVQARRRVYEFARTVIAHHKRTQRARRDIIDDLLAAYEARDIFNTEEEFLFAVIGPFLAGMDTVANTLGFMLYALLKHPRAMERVQRDATMLLEGGATVEKLKQCQALNGAVRETLRLYPVVPAVWRSVTQPFEFHGYRIEEGERVMLAVTVPHYLPEHYNNPFAFDIDRFAADRVPPTAGAFAPFGLGTHACLGSALAEVMISVTAATLLSAYRIKVERLDYNLNVAVNPIVTASNFDIRVFHN